MQGEEMPLERALKMMSTEAFAMTSAVRRPLLKRRLAEEAPMCCISVSATMSCFTPWKARDCTGTACQNQAQHVRIRHSM